MILLTGTQRDRLLANGRERDQDHLPVVKFFHPLGEGVWLATELDEDGDILFVRRQGFWDNRRFELTEALVHQGYHFMLRLLGEASGVV